MTYGKRTLIAVDQLLNTLLGGWPDETLSSRCYRWARDGGEGMAPARGGRAVLLAEGTLQKQLREREGRQAVAAGIEEAGMSRIGECESGRTWNGFRVEGGKAGQGVKFERIRRITGYLVGTVERFNDAKRAEVMDRVKHTV
jgi:hypothetical protein